MHLSAGCTRAISTYLAAAKRVLIDLEQLKQDIIHAGLENAIESANKNGVFSEISELDSLLLKVPGEAVEDLFIQPFLDRLYQAFIELTEIPQVLDACNTYGLPRNEALERFQIHTAHRVLEKIIEYFSECAKYSMP